jgi:magnesium transporter
MTEQQMEALHYYYLTDIVGTKIVNNGKKIGKLADVVITENHNLPYVSAIYVSRFLGDPSLIIPWSHVISFSKQEIAVNIEELKKYEAKPGEHDIMLKDHVLDKKVIDTHDKDVEVVYDVHLLLKDHKLYVSDVDLSKFRMLWRLGFRKIAKFLQFIAGKMKDQRVSWKYIQQLPSDIDRFKGDVKLNVLKERLEDIHPADLADIIEELDYNERAAIFNELGTRHASETLEEIDPYVQRDLAETMPQEKLIKLLSLMTTGQIADVLSALPRSQAKAILQTFPEEITTKVKTILGKHDEKVLNLTTDKIIKCPPTATAGDVQKSYHTLAKGKDVVMYVYITDEQNQLLGTLDIKELLAANENAKLADVMVTNVIKLRPTSIYKEASDIFARYDFRAIPVVDNNHVLLGAVTYKDLILLKHRFIS